MFDSARLGRPYDQDACSLCRGATRGGANLHGERVCGVCLRRLNADPGTKRAIMFAAFE